jgi:Cof subfamily protein (haloacid dehalogenase superfamily)
MKKYLISLDLDGTLLYDWETISNPTIEYIKELKKQGHQFVIATGRPYRSSVEFHTLLGLDTPLINYNGGLVTSKNDPDFKEYSLTVKKKYVIDIFENTKKYIKNAFAEVKDDIYLLHETEEIRPLLHHFNGSRLFVGDIKDILDKDTNGSIIIANEGQGKYIESYIKENYAGKVLSRNWGNEYESIIELFTPKTDKGYALEYVANYLGYKREDIIAFGDGHNDIEMIQFAGLGVVMNNAHEELKEVADIILEETNKEDGVIKFLKYYLK